MWPSAANVAHFAMTPAIAMLRMIHMMFIDIIPFCNGSSRRFESSAFDASGMCRTGQCHRRDPARLASMSERNGDRARFQKDRKRKMHRRQRIQALMLGLRKPADEHASTHVAALNMNDEGGPVRIGD